MLYNLKNIEPKYKRLGASLILILGLSGYLFFHFSEAILQPEETSKIDIRIQALEERMRFERPINTALIVELSHAYLQKVRESADTTYYKNVDILIEALREQEPTHPDVPALGALTALGRHDFTEAKSLAEKAREINPAESMYYGIAADAAIELGAYEEAVDLLQAMADLNLSAAALTRIAYIRELYGERDAAIEAMEQSLELSAPYPEHTAWNLVELGRLTLPVDRDRAEALLQEALLHVPDYAPAYKWLGYNALARGDSDGARELFGMAFDTLPVAEYATDLAAIEARIGNAGLATQLEHIVETTYIESAKRGTNIDAEYARFLTDHNRNLDEALTRARAAYAAAPTIHNADTLAWALYKHGNLEAAHTYTQESLRLNTQDARLYYHAGMIAQARDEHASAREYLETAHRIDPYFSILQADNLKEVLSVLKSKEHTQSDI